MIEKPPLPRNGALADLQARFLKHVDKTSSPKGCWLWVSSTRGGGYGNISIRMPDGHMECLAHRIAYIWWIGPIPAGKEVCHRGFCNNPHCVNPDHLYADTHQQ